MSIVDATNKWQRAIHDWLSALPLRESSRRAYRSVVETFAAEMSLADPARVRPVSVRRFLAKRLAAGMSRSRCCGYLRVLRLFWRSAHTGRRGNPVTPELLREWKPYRPARKACPHVWAWDDCERLIRQAGEIGQSPTWWRAWLRLMHDAGLRVDEAAHLRWCDARLAQGIEIRVHSESETMPWAPKGAGSLRTIGITDRLGNALAVRYAEQSDSIPYVFLDAARWEALRQTPEQGAKAPLPSIQRDFGRLRRHAGISHGGTMHDLRRTCITNWARQPRLTAKDVQYLAGHASLHTTLAIYAVIEREDTLSRQRAAMELA